MPSFRDLKGRPVEETLESVPSAPGAPNPGEAAAERDAVRAAVEKVNAMREGTRRERGERREMAEETGEPSEPYVLGGGALSPFQQRVVLPADMEAGLADLESALAVLVEHATAVQSSVVHVRAQIAAIRARAEKDAGKLARLAELLKTIGE